MTVIFDRSELCKNLHCNLFVIEALEQRTENPLPYFVLEANPSEHLYNASSIDQWACMEILRQASERP